MKRTLFLICAFFLLAVTASAQVGKFNKLTVTDSTKLVNLWINGITTGLATSDSSRNDRIPTSKAVWDALRSIGPGGGPETDPSVSGAVKALTGTDTANFKTAFRKMVVGVLYDSVTRLFRINLNDGSFYQDTIQINATNYYPTGLSFNAGTGLLTMTRFGLGNLVADLRGLFVETIARRRDSVFAVKNGVESFQYIDSTGGAGSSPTNLGRTLNPTTIVITSSTGASTTIPASDGTNAGIFTGANKRSVDSSVTKIMKVNDSVTYYFNSQGLVMWSDTIRSVRFLAPFRVIDSYTLGIAHDSAAWNAEKIRGVNVSPTTPTTGQVMKYDGTVWKPDTDNAGAGGGTLQDALAAGRTLLTNDSVGLSGKYFKFFGNTSNINTESLIIGKKQFSNAVNAGWNPLIFESLSTDAKASSFYFKHNQTAQTGTFPNNVMKIGWNPDLVEANKKGLWIAMESNYQTTPTDSIQEFHISSQGTTWGETRLLSYTLFNRNGLLGENQSTNIFSNLDLRAESVNFLTTTNRSFASISQNKTSRVAALTIQSGNGVALNLSVDSAQNLISFNQQFGPTPRVVDFFRDGNTRDVNFYNFRVTTNAGVEFQGYAGVNTDSTHDFGGYSTRFKRFYAGQVGMNRQLVGNLSAWGNHYLTGELIKHTPYADNRSVFMRMTNAAGSSTIYSVLNDGTLSIPTGGYDYSRSVWQPSLTFAGRDTTGFMLHTGNVITAIDRGSKIAGFYKEGDASYLQFYATNRGMISSEAALVFNANNSHYEFEGLGDWRLSIVGYGTGSSQGKTIIYETDPTLSVTPLGAMGRNGKASFKIYDSLYRSLSLFDMLGNLRIGDTTYTGNAGIHVASNMTSLGHEQIVLRDKFDLTNRWGIAKENAYTEDLVFSYNGAEKGGFTNNGKLFVGLHNPEAYNLSVLGTGRFRSTAASDADGAVLALEGVNLSNQSLRMVYNPSGTPTTIWEIQGNFNTGEIRNFIKAGGGYFHTWYSNGTKSMTLNNEGELQIGSTTNYGAYTFQNTGGLYQQGSVRLGGLAASISSDSKVLVLGNDSLVREKNISELVKSIWNQEGVDSANTSDATATTVKTLVIPDASRGILEVWMDCIGTDDGTKGLTGIKRVRYKKIAGTLTLGTVETEMTIDHDGGLTTANFTMVASSNNIVIQVTGEAATNLKWKPTFRLTNNAIAL